MTDAVRAFIMTAKRKGKKGGDGDSAKRSAFLKIAMGEISGDHGKALANAIAAKDLEQFKSLWSKTTSAIIGKLEKEFGEANAAPKEQQEVIPPTEG